MSARGDYAFNLLELFDDYEERLGDNILLEEAKRELAAMRARLARLEAVEADRTELRKAIVEASNLLTNTMKNAPFNKLEDAIAFRDIIGDAILKVHKIFAAALADE